uniref:NADH-ubiquinone oxidoreductase chain 2 n=1 Tax=Bostrichoidea sp. KM-2015 TaxID=1903809 RepID=A0A343A6Q9_9COLE|nr:NADH dehydrogenase subunit 2 [Bostrichoidea sp. KM-2015]
MIFLTTLVLGTGISISAQSWMGLWMGLEMNLLSIVPLMNSSKNMLASECSLKYFFTQAIASTVLIYSLIILSLKNNMNSWILTPPLPIIMDISLFMKMGAAPLHFWFPEVMEGLSWMNALVMMTWQKIAPLTALFNVPKPPFLIQATIIMSILIGGLMGINQTSMRKILAYSSITHLGWMISTLSLNLSLTLNYFMIYSLISLNLIMILKTLNLFHIQQLFTINNNLMKISFLSNFLSMGGVPPFLGFLPKWMVLNSLAKNHLNLSLMMVVLTLVTLYFYTRCIIPFLTLETSETKYNWKKMPNFLMWWMNWFNIMALILCTVWFNLT